jgi:hypothetical protein
MIALAMDRVEQRIRDGSATSQELCHFLKLATTKEKLEKEKLELELELTKAKTELIKSEKNSEELYREAVSAIRKYQGVYDEE